MCLSFKTIYYISSMCFLFCIYSFCFLFPRLPLYYWANKEGKKWYIFIINIIRDGLCYVFSFSVGFFFPPLLLRCASMFLFVCSLSSAPWEHFNYISVTSVNTQKRFFINFKNVLLLWRELYIYIYIKKIHRISPESGCWMMRTPLNNNSHDPTESFPEKLTYKNKFRINGPSRHKPPRLNNTQRGIISGSNQIGKLKSHTDRPNFTGQEGRSGV